MTFTRAYCFACVCVIRVIITLTLLISVGYMGECGLRGGYTEVVNMDPAVKAMLLKSISAKLCPTVLGQATMDCVVAPPKPGEPSYDLFIKEKTAVLQSLKERAEKIAETFNSMPGVKCNVVQGAMYAFPQVYFSFFLFL